VCIVMIYIVTNVRQRSNAPDLLRTTCQLLTERGLGR
jgi:hypothetical protein